MKAGADFVPRVSLTSTTVAPGMTPPCESLIVPDTVPVVIWAQAGAATASHIAAARIGTLMFTIM